MVLDDCGWSWMVMDCRGWLWIAAYYKSYTNFYDQGFGKLATFQRGNESVQTITQVCSLAAIHINE